MVMLVFVVVGQVVGVVLGFGGFGSVFGKVVGVVGGVFIDQFLFGVGGCDWILEGSCLVDLLVQFFNEGVFLFCVYGWVCFVG